MTDPNPKYIAQLSARDQADQLREAIVSAARRLQNAGCDAAAVETGAITAAIELGCARNGTAVTAAHLRQLADSIDTTSCQGTA